MSLSTRRAVSLAAAPALIAGLTLPTVAVAAADDTAATPASATLARHSKTPNVLIANVNPNLPRSLDYTFRVQQLTDGQWKTIATRRTHGSREIKLLTGLPSGTYKVVVPEQYGKGAGESAPLTHSAPQAKLRMIKKLDSAVVKVAPKLPAARYQVALQRRAGNAWRTVRNHVTTGVSEAARFAQLPKGTYRTVTATRHGVTSGVSNSITVSVTRAQLQAAKARVARAKLLRVARAQVGKPYVSGGTGPYAFDCSGFVGYTYRTALGVHLPRTASQQYYAPQLTKKFRAGQDKPEVGDIIYFLNNGAQHVGLYVGGGKMIHAANPSTGVQLTTYNMGWYASSFTGYGRVVAG